jgi:hypothetical protein
MLKQDPATKLSIEYLNCLERKLAISYDQSGQPLFVPNRVTHESFRELRGSLNEVLNGSSRGRALEATREFGESKCQTVGFGLVKDFDSFVKLGLLYGDRTVLWDLICGRLLIHYELTADQQIAVGQAACNLLLLRPIVEAGGVVILPDPSVWCEFAKLVKEELSDQNNKSPATYGSPDPEDNFNADKTRSTILKESLDRGCLPLSVTLTWLPTDDTPSMPEKVVTKIHGDGTNLLDIRQRLTPSVLDYVIGQLRSNS